MAEPFSDETQLILDAADRAIARSRELIAQRKCMLAECRLKLYQQEKRFELLRGLRKPS